MTLIKLTHANTDKEAFIVKEQIFGFNFSDAHKCNIVYSTGGAVFPVKESRDELVKLLTSEKGE